MPRRKLKKFKEINESALFKDLQENPEHIDLSEWFGNDNPVILELGAGYGEYAIGLAQQHPEYNYIAVDIKSDRLWMGLQWSQEKGLSNVRFIRCNIYRIDEIFDKHSIDDIWLTFSDPQPHKPRKRLTHQQYLAKYYVIQKPGSKIYIKTDSDLLYESALETARKYEGYELITSTKNPNPKQTKNITTRYEKKFSELGYSIKYIELERSN